MDTKSMAKSKRAHSQHLSKKHHPSPTQKGPSIGASSSKKPQGKEIKRKPPSSSSLPSNWDRYGEEFDLGTEDSINQPTDVILPKSKGADYSYLISEAESQYQTSCSAEIFPSFDDVVQEASFLSLDLHALAEQLGKVDLSKRLFIEADQLPLELFPEELHASHNSHQNQVDCQKTQNKVSKKDSDELPANTVFDRTSDAMANNHLVQGFGKDRLKQIDHVKEVPGQFSKPGQRSGTESSVSQDPKKKLSGFEASAAEAELDMLLGSFNQTNLVDSPGIIEKSNTLMYQGEKTILPLSRNDLLAKKDSGLSKSALAANLDVTLDDLLKETSSLVRQSSASLSDEVKALPMDSRSSPSSGIASKAKVLDDFDSWLDTI